MLKDLQAFEYIEEQKWISFDLKSNLFLYLALEKCQGFNPSFFQLLKRQNLLNPHQFEELMDYLESLSLEKESFSEVQEKEEEPLPVEFGKFLLEAKIGQGGMGVIYRARQKDLKRVVALKVLRQDFENNPEQIHRFQREAEAMAKLKHKNIIAIYETGKVNNLPYFTMEYIDGHSLEELLDKNSLDLFSGLEIVESLARALDYAHSRGVIHRDIKPSNILIDKDNIPKLTDFGLAKNLDSHSLITHTGEIVGTVNYMSPEQALGQSRNMDGRSDIYSLSIILYQIACGRLPFQGDTTVETLRKIAEEDPLLPRKIRPTIPWEVEYIIMKGLEKQASHRYQHATDLADDIRRFLEGEAINIKGYSFWNRLLRKTEKYKALLIAASIAIFITILFLFEYHYSKIRIQKLQEATKKTMRRTRMEAAAFEAFMFLERGQPYFALEKLNQAIFQFPKSPRLVFLKGKALEKLGKLQEAIQAFSQAYKLEPSFLEPLFARAEVYHSLKDYDHSLEDYTAIIQKNPKFFHAYLGRAEVLCEKGRGEEALLDIQKLLQMNKDFGKVYYLRGRAKLSMGFLEQALLDFQRAEEKGFSSMAMKFYKGKCLLSLGEEQSALQLFEELFNQKTPFKLKAARTWAKYLLQKGEYAKSIPPLLWVEKHSSSSEGIRLLSQAYFRMGHMKEFLEWMEKLPLEKLKDKEKLQMAIIYFLEGKNNKGVQILQHLRGEDFQIWKPFMLVFVVGDLSQAMRELSILLHKRPKWGDLYGLRGVIYYKKGEFYKALQEFNFAKNLRAKLPFTYAYRGICNLVLEKWKESREDFERATTLSLDPRTPWGKLFRQGTVKFKQRLPYMATRFFELALLYNPVFAKAYYHLGQTLLCLIQVKKPLGELWIKCKASFLKAHKFDPYFEPNYLKLALVYLVEEKKESWTDLLKKIRSLGLSNKLQKIIKTLSKYGAKKDIKILVSLLQKEKESLSKTPLLLNILHFLIQNSRQKANPKKVQTNFDGFFFTNQADFKKNWSKIVKDFQNHHYLRAYRLTFPLIERYPFVSQLYLLRAEALYKINIQNPPFLYQNFSPLKEEDIFHSLLQVGLDYSHAIVLKGNHFGSLLESDFFKSLVLLFSILPFSQIEKRILLPLENWKGFGEPEFLKAFFYWTLYEKIERRKSFLSKAKAALEKAVIINPHFSMAWTLLGYCHLLERDIEESEKAFQRAQEIEPTSAFNFLYWACLLAYRKKYSLAFQKLFEAVDHGINHLRWIENNPYFKELRCRSEWKVLKERFSKGE